MRRFGAAGGSGGGGGGGALERTADDEDILRFIRGGNEGGGGEAPGRAGEATSETEEDAFDALMDIDACEFADNLGVGTNGYCSPRRGMSLKSRKEASRISMRLMRWRANASHSLLAGLRLQREVGPLPRGGAVRGTRVGPGRHCPPRHRRAFLTLVY